MSDAQLPPGPTSTDRCRRWARRQLDAGDHASAADLQALLLARVEQADFVPEASVLAAYRVLRDALEDGADPVVPREFQQEDERELLAETEQLAGQMLALPLAERHRRWLELHQRSGRALRVRGRLESLQPGLKADLARVDPHDEFAVQLSRSLGELFPLSPPQRAGRRDALLTRLRSLDGFKTRAVSRFRRRYPELAALDSLLLDRLAGDSAPARIRRRLRPSTVRPAGTAVATRGDDRSSYWWLIGLILMLSAIVRGVLTFDVAKPPGRPANTYHARDRDPPTYPLASPGQRNPGLDPDEASRALERLLQSIRKAAPDESRPVPPHVPPPSQPDRQPSTNSPVPSIRPSAPPQRLAPRHPSPSGPPKPRDPFPLPPR